MTLCARDRRSFDILQECFPKAHNLLVPDMAFCAPVPLRDSHRAGRILYLSRNDEGGSPAVKVLIPRHADVLDLPAERPFLVRQRYAFRLAVNRALLGAGRPLGLFRDRRYDAAGPLPYRSTDSYLRETAALVSSYEMVITERLHGHLLACMMGVPSILLDNNYGKCRSFHETWLTAIPGSYFAGSIGELEHLIRQLGI
jgi:pyruvyl transferase EpsO